MRFQHFSRSGWQGLLIIRGTRRLREELEFIKVNNFKVAHKQKGQLTISGEWAKHLRGFLKRQFWKGERSAAKLVIKNNLKDH